MGRRDTRVTIGCKRESQVTSTEGEDCHRIESGSENRKRPWVSRVWGCVNSLNQASQLNAYLRIALIKKGMPEILSDNGHSWLPL